MDFIDEIKALATRVPKKLEHLQTEEATKNALVMPFINALWLQRLRSHRGDA